MVDTRPNEITSEQVEPFIRKIDSLLRDLESERGAYMNRCKGIRGQIRDAFAEAKDGGIPRKAFEKAVESLKLQRRLNAIRERLEEDTALEHDQIIGAIEGLEDLPLGIAAVEREKREAAAKKLARARKRSAAVDKLAGEDEGDGATAH